ncbi:MAG: alpha/beta fold hydrolase [Actinomycetales bacterium]|nr:alpha/beta fold hydrolase [Actinomycetales bacterium]
MTPQPDSVRTIRLDDGRVLAWHEFGDAAGFPCLFFPGSATSGRAGSALDEAAQRIGAKLISVDRPGLGASTRAPRRALRDWAADIEELSSALTLTRFAVLGHSAGGAFALAVAASMPRRVTRAVIAAGSPPYAERWTRDDHLVAPTTRFNNFLALATPALFGRLFRLSAPRTRDAAERMVSALSRGRSEDSRFVQRHPEIARLLMESLGDGFAGGPDGPAEDVAIIARAWGFGLDAVSVPVHWWHGSADRNVRTETGRAIVARIPRATAHVISGGHFLLYDHAPEILASLTE